MNLGRLTSYPDYKSTGPKWCVNIPSHWKTERAKWLFKKMNRPVEASHEVVTCFRDGMVTLRKNRRLRGFTEAIFEFGYQGIRKGDLVIHAMDAFAGAVGVSDSDGKGTPVYSVLQPNPGVNPNYFAFVVREMARTQWILALSKGIRERSTDFRYETFANQWLPLPPLEEQDKIVRFLDWANNLLDRAIRAKKKVIALLNEQKQAIIHQAVTRGIDPDVKMKDSGIPWLGEIPGHWEVRKLKHVTKTIGGLTPNKTNEKYWSGAISWISPKDMKRSFIDSSVDHISEAAITETGIQLINPPAVLIVVRGMILAKKFPSAVSRIQLAINQDMKALICTSELIPEFLSTVFQGLQYDILNIVDESGHGTRCLRTEAWERFSIPVPPEQDQKMILDVLSKRTGNISARISTLESEISFIREFQIKLVSDVVAGKMDVRAAIPSTSMSEKLGDDGDDLGELEDPEETAVEDVAA